MHTLSHLHISHIQCKQTSQHQSKPLHTPFTATPSCDQSYVVADIRQRDSCNPIITQRIATTPHPTHKSHFNNHRPCPIPPVRSITSTHSLSNRLAILSLENSWTTLFCPLLPISAGNPLNAFSMIPGHCESGLRNPVKLSSIVSSGPPVGVARTGVECNCASRGTIPKCSFVGV